MIQLQLLEDVDIICRDDWCRPLHLMSMSDGRSDGYSFKSQYSGGPENNLKWVRVRDAIGGCWFDKTVGEFNSRLMIPYEFIRGDLPKNHQLNMTGYNSLDRSVPYDPTGRW